MLWVGPSGHPLYHAGRYCVSKEGSDTAFGVACGSEAQGRRHCQCSPCHCLHQVNLTARRQPNVVCSEGLQSTYSFLHTLFWLAQLALAKLAAVVIMKGSCRFAHMCYQGQIHLILPVLNASGLTCVSWAFDSTRGQCHRRT